jgi:hypothetical protein
MVLVTLAVLGVLYLIGLMFGPAPICARCALLAAT